MADLHIRIPDELDVKLRSIAKKKNISKSELIKRILIDYAASPDIKNIEDKYQNLVKDIVAMYQNELDKTKEQLEENNYLLKQISDKL